MCSLPCCENASSVSSAGWIIIPTRRLRLALEYFMKEGYFALHIRRMRRLYSEKRTALVQALSPLQAIASCRGLEARLQTFAAFDAQGPIAQLLQSRLSQGSL